MRTPYLAGLLTVTAIVLLTSCGGSSGVVVNRPTSSLPSTSAASSASSPSSSPTTGGRPAIVVEPSTKLRDQQQVTVTGTGFSPGEALTVIECAQRGTATGPGDCNLSGMVPVTADSSGTASVKLAVLRGPFGSSRVVCSATVPCLVSMTQASLSPTEEADAPISFAAG